MLSIKEKKEILQDARSLKRRASFRKTQVTDFNPSIDAYLKFLTSIDKVFSKTASLAKYHGTIFKL